MAGGIGSRFWPVSRTQRPKQFLDILGTGQSLIQQAFERIRKVIPVENIFIVTNVLYKSLVTNQIPEIKPSQILLEPDRRNTAPCVAYAIFEIQRICSDAIILVTPADHLILKEENFRNVIIKALAFADANDSLLTIGLKPLRPETGYGYIQVHETKADDVKSARIKKVKAFTEKPDIALARVFIDSGDFYWNSGIFVWSLETIMKAFEIHLPDIYVAFKKIYTHSKPSQQQIDAVYKDCQNISLDYGILEKAGNVHVLPSDFGWSDLGNWSAVYELSEKDTKGNAFIRGEVMTYNTKNCLIHLPNNKLLIINGLDGYIIVDSEDALLICKMQDEQKIKDYVNDITLKKGGKYL